MTQAYIDDATAGQIKEALAGLFPTFKKIGDTADLVLFRDSEEDGTPVTLPPQNVLVTFAPRQPTEMQGQGAEYSGRDGELQKEWPFDVQRADRFTLPSGLNGEIVTAPYQVGRVVHAPFRVVT